MIKMSTIARVVLAKLAQQPQSYQRPLTPAGKFKKNPLAAFPMKKKPGPVALKPIGGPGMRTLKPIGATV